MEMKVNIENTAPEQDRDRGWVVVNVKMVLGLLGAAACLGWIAVTILAGPLDVQDLAIEFQSVVAHIAFLACIVLVAACSAPLSDYWSAHRKAFFAAAGIMLVFGTCTAFFSAEDPAMWMMIASPKIRTPCSKVLPPSCPLLMPLYSACEGSA